MKKLKLISLNVNLKSKLDIIAAPAFSAAAVGLLQTVFDLPFLCFAAMVPFCISVLYEHDFKRFLAKTTLYTFLNNFINLFFLIKVYDLIPVIKPTAFIISFILIWAISALLGAVTALPLLVFPKINKGRIADCFIFAFLYIFGEYLTGFLPFIPFPWTRLELSAISFTPFMQFASLFGGRFIGIVIAAVNALIASALKSAMFRKKTFAAALSAFALYAVCFSAGMFMISGDNESGSEINVMAAQGSVMGSEKWGTSSAEVYAEYRSMFKSADLENIDMALLPETAVAANLNESDIKDELSKTASENNTVIVTGAFYRDEDDGRRYNSLSVIEPDSSAPAENYYKQKLVPFGEYVPFGHLLSQKDSLKSGNENKILETSLGKMTPVVCIESIYSRNVRKQCRDGGEIILVSTNDSWFENTSARAQHLRHSRLLAIENGRFLVRAANCGISAIITPSGEFSEKLDSEDAGYIVGEVSMISGLTLFTKTGDLFWIISLLIFLHGLNKCVRQSGKIKFSKGRF